MRMRAGEPSPRKPIDRYLTASQKVRTDDLDWEAAARAGLSDDEAFVLTYFADIEGQTVMYLRDFLGTRAARDPDTLAFLSVWNYEELFHGHALERLLAVCGRPLDHARVAKVRGAVALREKLEAVGASLLSRLFPASFVALYLAWGAVQELTTLRGYERLAVTTGNPVLRELCRRIAKQERRHFAWYFNNARAHLSASRFSRWFVRTLLGACWTPVGQGVKEKAEVVRLFRTLFDGAHASLAGDIDGRVGELPGMEGLALFGRRLLPCVQSDMTTMC